jgi:hypothetical protein
MRPDKRQYPRHDIAENGNTVIVMGKNSALIIVARSGLAQEVLPAPKGTTESLNARTKAKARISV